MRAHEFNNNIKICNYNKQFFYKCFKKSFTEKDNKFCEKY